MKKVLTMVCLGAVLSAAAGAGALAADNPPPAMPPKPTYSPLQLEANAILKNVKAKVDASKQKGAGKITAADLAEELKAFDALLAKHAGEKTDEVAQASLMKIMLFGYILNDQAAYDQQLKQWKADFKGTKLCEAVEKKEAARAEFEKSQAALAPGKPFPDFDEKDLSGQPLSVGRFKGKVVLVDFWATWCGPCVHELPNVLETFKKYHAQGFEIIGISLDQNREKLETFIKQHEGMTWPQYFDGKGWGNKLAQQYGVQGIPFTLLVGPDGKIIGRGLRGAALGEAVGTALKK